jgi:Secretion system C-terminal sorting domain
VKDGPQIYVIYFLIGIKMKKILILFFTLSGICSGFAQTGEVTSVPDSSATQGPLKGQLRKDSIPGKEKPSAKLFPNPATNKVEIEIKGFNPGFVQVQIMDNDRKLIREDKRLLLSGNEVVMLMFSLQPGLYFVTVKQNEKFCKRQLIVQ